MTPRWPLLATIGLVLTLSGCQDGPLPLAVAGSPAPSSAPVAIASPTPLPPLYEAERVTAEAAHARIAGGEPIVVVDVRSAEAYALSHLAGAINLPWADLEKGYQQLPKDRFILLYCT